MGQQEINSSLKYMDWNPYLHSVNDDLNVINTLIPPCYQLGQGHVKRLAINLQALYYSRETFIRLPKVKEIINGIIANLHKPQFAQDYNDGNKEALLYEYNCIQKLLDCHSKIVSAFSKNNLIPEVEFRVEEKRDSMYDGVAV